MTNNHDQSAEPRPIRVPLARTISSKDIVRAYVLDEKHQRTRIKAIGETSNEVLESVGAVLRQRASASCIPEPIVITAVKRKKVFVKRHHVTTAEYKQAA
jgi:hypothetical protein